LIKKDSGKKKATTTKLTHMQVSYQ
jgi:hypothetical protein